MSLIMKQGPHKPLVIGSIPAAATLFSYFTHFLSPIKNKLTFNLISTLAFWEAFQVPRSIPLVTGVSRLIVLAKGDLFDKEVHHKGKNDNKETNKKYIG